VGPDGRFADADRIEYLRSHLAAVTLRITAGAPVTGYTCGRCFTNFECAWGFGKRFGIVHVDYATPSGVTRIAALPRRLAEWIKGNSV